jgi:hypothetical protein
VVIVRGTKYLNTWRLKLAKYIVTHRGMLDLRAVSEVEYYSDAKKSVQFWRENHPNQEFRIYRLEDEEDDG